MQLVNICRILLVISLIISTLPACSQATTKSTIVQTYNGKKYYIHKVEKGQSLYAIARLYETEVNSIVIENPEAIDGIKPGQELKIPFKKEATSGLSTTGSDLDKYKTHKVQKGETVYGISKKYNLTETEFFSLNPEAKNGLKEGQILKVGQKAGELTMSTGTNVTTSGDYETYTVQKGETVYAITKKFNLSLDEFYKLNSSAKEGVSEGQTVKIRLKKIQAPDPINNASATTDAVSSIISDTTMSAKKSEYTIGLFLPFEFNETDLINTDQLIRDKKDFPETQTIALDFYEGVKYALDSLQNKDIKYTLNILDTQDRDSMQVDKILKKEDFDNMDLIIGPMFNSTFKIVSEKARENKVPIVSPVTQQNKVLFNNPYSSKTTPSGITLIEALAEFVADSFRTANVVIVNSGKPKEFTYLKTFKSHYNEYLATTYKNTKDTIQEVKGYAGAKVAYNSLKKNYFVILSEDEVFLTDILTQLNGFIDRKKELNVIGLKKWIFIDHLDPEYLNKFNFTFPAPFYIDYSKQEIKYAVQAYREKYYTDPSDFYFQGIDVATYYMNALKDLGPDFYKKLDTYKAKGMIMDFNFFRPSTTTGFDNRSLQLIRYSDYTFKKIN